MNEEKRNRLIEHYLDGMDLQDKDLLRDAFAPDIVHEHPVRNIDGIEDFLLFKVDEQPPQESEHKVSRRIHVPEASVVQGRKVGTVEGEPVDAQFCDVYEFNADESAITKLSVYVRE
ncbi:nuclear transport factor 2 family protein [Halobacteria archaeon AArc-m2/3/4]|uniref:Nuclear transport factor 2 family protein n=1 Tax=Natronoglomus mannanivorans TaxID=2979990 RepID=A0AAP2Z3E7_9EURY|nr:nuclear transport factor 2 family protein [Halobacteria archaeon AArc-xg1-1]MCU4974014.1 nuclear transport factor 2 family protein [Halobacteria archaeon AArc-m2/3/4]